MKSTLESENFSEIIMIKLKMIKIKTKNAEQTRNQHHSIVTVHVQLFPLYIGLINLTQLLIIIEDKT